MGSVSYMMPYVYESLLKQFKDYHKKTPRRLYSAIGEAFKLQGRARRTSASGVYQTSVHEDIKRQCSRGYVYSRAKVEAENFDADLLVKAGKG